jgi:hypothetical protein
VGGAALGFHFRLARLKPPRWLKNFKALPFSEPKQPTAEKTGFEGEDEVGLRSPGQIRDKNDESFQEQTYRTCEDSKKSPTRIRGDNEICGRPQGSSK